MLANDWPQAQMQRLVTPANGGMRKGFSGEIAESPNGAICRLTAPDGADLEGRLGDWTAPKRLPQTIRL